MRTVAGDRTLPCDGTVLDKTRVKWNSGTSMLTLAGATDPAIGHVNGVPVNGRCVIISPLCEDGVALTSNSSIALGCTVYAAANGQVSSSSAGGALVVGTNWQPNLIAGGWADVQLAKATG